MPLYPAFVLVHLACGAVALAAFWIAALARKGSRVHRQAGKWHLLAIAGVLGSAVPMTLEFLLHRSVAFGLFLAYLLVLVGTSAWCGWQAVRSKGEWARYTGTGFRLFTWLNLIVGSTVVVLGIFVLETLRLPIIVVGLLGIGNFARMHLFARRAPADPRWWLNEHLRAMIGSGAGSHVAFLFFGLPKLLPMFAGSGMQNFAWLAPIIAAGVAGTYLQRKYVPRRLARYS